MYLRDDLVDNQPDGYDKAYQEEHYAPYSEDVHGLLAESGEEPDSHQVEEPVEEAAHPELALAVFALAVYHHLFTYFGKPCIFCDVGDVAVHVTVDFDFFHYVASVGFESAVHVVQLQPGDLAGGEVVYF